MPDRCVVDTDVVSFLFKGDSRMDLYRPHLTGALMVISFMTVAELDEWAFIHNWGLARRARMDAFLDQFVIHPSDRALCRAWAAVRNQARRRGRPIEGADAWIAATALVHGIPLVSHNARHYAGIEGLVVIAEGQ